MKDGQDTTKTHPGKKIMDNPVPSKSNAYYIKGVRHEFDDKVIDKSGKPVKPYTTPPAKPTPRVSSSGVMKSNPHEKAFKDVSNSNRSVSRYSATFKDNK
jgi:hypothetical protein